MSSPDLHQLLYGVPITCHAWNKDRSMVAISPNNHEVHIYKKSGSTFTVAHVLNEHDKLVTSIDWAPNSNRIVTCSQDRNAYVWTWDGSLWKPTLVLLRINRAATFVRWSPFENKFAVASGARCISVCYFEEDNDWWVSKHIKKPIRSTVLSLDWHPENILLVSGSADMTARVFSAFIKGTDTKASSPVWGEKLPFGTVCAEYSNGPGGWVHGVAFAPSGNFIGWVGHDSSLSLASPAWGPAPVTIKTSTLPLMSMIFTSENTIVAAGHDCTPYLFANQNNKWVLVDKMDRGQKKSTTGDNAMAKFKQMDSKAQAGQGDTELTTNHQNTITSVRAYAGPSGSVTRFSTSGVDGKLAVWDTSLSDAMSGMRMK
ncbi:hypothetical protein SmJEL517_g05557 [Synchytrium microbalum]|uniref:Actin-related protein 2/3 complex subunit n=1 Tax=Synchytrium microbalum TaxID=1806994 RepID=A0A507BKK8_9FUNG|nr:uncharacterized protein SmJEL517_g05557 [Synchytrium microbalum]TPX31000.1 hypothetical protein SmJEL517_g05557 [Synchytrium microbalum]